MTTGPVLGGLAALAVLYFSAFVRETYVLVFGLHEDTFRSHAHTQRKHGNMMSEVGVPLASSSHNRIRPDMCFGCATHQQQPNRRVAWCLQRTPPTDMLWEHRWFLPLASLHCRCLPLSCLQTPGTLCPLGGVCACCKIVSQDRPSRF